MVKLVLLSLLLIFNLPASKPDSAGCDKLIIEKEITRVPGKNQSNIKFKVSGGDAPYHCLGLYKSGKPMSDERDKLTFDGLAPGSYDFFIYDNKGCTQLVAVEIK